MPSVNTADSFTLCGIKHWTSNDKDNNQRKEHGVEGRQETEIRNFFITI